MAAALAALAHVRSVGTPERRKCGVSAEGGQAQADRLQTRCVASVPTSSCLPPYTIADDFQREPGVERSKFLPVVEELA